jgi:hypothetical protein
MAKKSRKRRTAAPAAEVPGAGVVNRPAPERTPLALASPGGVGSLIGMVFGVGLLVLGVLGFARSEPLPTPLVVALVIAGALEAVLCWQTLHRSRTAWSFAVALSGTAAMVCILGAPKIASAMGAALPIALIPAVIAVVVTIALTMAADDVSTV